MKGKEKVRSPSARRSRLQYPPSDPQAAYLAAVEQAIAHLVEMGLVADSGLRRDGRIMWTLTPQGRSFADKMRDARTKK